MDTSSATWQSSGMMSWRAQITTDALYKNLIASLAQPIEGSTESIPSPGTDLRKAFPHPWVLPLTCLGLGCLGLVLNFHDNYWSQWFLIWAVTAVALLVSLLSFPLAWLNARRRKRYAQTLHQATNGVLSVHTLRQAIIEGDDVIAPPIPPVSSLILPDASAMTSSALPVRLKVASPFRRFLRGQRSSALFSIFPQLFLLVEFVVLMLLGMSIFTWMFLLFLALMAATALWRFVALTRLARPASVAVGQEGLSWRIGRRRFALPWEEARGWAVINLPEPPPWNAWKNRRQTSDSASALYALIGEHATLVWTQQSIAVQPTPTSPMLSDFVMTRVAIPLRDLTKSATRLTEELQGRAKRHEREMALTPGAGSIPVIRQLSVPSAGIFLTLSVLVALAAALTPFAQQRLFGGQLHQVEAAQPQMRDPLTSDTLGWTPAPPDAADGFAFASNGYVFVETACCDSSSLVSGVMSDGLIEITMRQVAGFDLSPAGLLFRADPTTHTALAFTITPNAEWHLEQFTLGDDGALTNERDLRYKGVIFGVGAIHRGVDATNRLAVLMSGSSYTFFVNGQFVGGYQANDLPQTGQVGVYAEGTGDLLVFSDLLISPPPIGA